MMLRNVLLVSISALAISGCAGKQKPPLITYDNEAFTPAVAITEPHPIEPLLTVDPQPKPLPTIASPSRPPEEPEPILRVETANAAALHEPTSYGYMDAVQVYPFREGALYKLYAAQGHVSDVALQPGETLSAVSAGDTVRWVIGDTTSGSGDTKRVHVLVKPFAPDLQTNLVIATDRRIYHLQLESTDTTPMAMVTWTYPQDNLIAYKRKQAEEQAATPVASGIALESLRFRYAVTGDNPPWRPIRAFDDGSKVYVEFPGRLDQGEAPPLFVVAPNGDNQLVNYRVRGNYYVIDRLFAAAELRLGEKPQQVVRISRTDGHKASR